jgi:uncharacterized protein (TIGR02453 family)
MQATLSFLKKLKSNNNRDWFEANRSRFLEVKSEFEALCDKVLTGIRKNDKALDKDMTAAECVYRIYRDVRFSKDKTPYKVHMAASFNPGGRKSSIAGYYLHIQPGDKSFVAGGVWMPEPAVLQAIRQEIDYHPEPLLKIMRSAGFRKYYKGFDEEDKLKTLPKGYSKDHPHIELLKNRHFILSHMLSDKEVLAPGAAQNITMAFKAMQPVMEYLRVAQDIQD